MDHMLFDSPMNRLARNFQNSPLRAAIWLQIAMYILSNTAVSVLEIDLDVPAWLTDIAIMGAIIGFTLAVLRQLGWLPAAGFARPVGSKWLWLATLTPAIAFVADGFTSRVRGRLDPTFLASTLAIAIGEEFANRGLILTALAKRGIPSAVLLSSALFGLAHLSHAFYSPLLPVLGLVLVNSALGAVWAAVRLRTGSIWPAVVGHFAADLAGGYFGFNPDDGSAIALTIDAVQTVLLWAFALLLLRGVVASRDAAGVSQAA